MTTITIDFETYYDDQYSLKKLKTLEYIRDPRFKAHGASLKIHGSPSRWVSDKDLPRHFAAIDWPNTTVVVHNGLFDFVILHEKYGAHPGRRVDTLGLCRALLPPDLDFSLGAICKLLGLGEKGTELVLSKGLRDLSPDIEVAIAGYAENDTDLTEKLFNLLYPELPEGERHTLDQVLRFSTEGVLQFDAGLANESKDEIVADRFKKAELIGLQVTPDGKVPILTSRDKFAELLRSAGIEPPMKISPNTGKETYAFSKQDPEFIALRSDPVAAPFVEAKMVWSSNSAITRIDALTNICSAEPRTLPVQLNYHGAHTGRFSGGGGINMQNLNRGSKLRLAIKAPKDHVIVVADASQIELRLNMEFSGQKDIIELLTPGEYVFKESSIEWKGGDVYSLEASRQFGIPREEISKNQRQYGKVCLRGDTQVLTKLGSAAPSYTRIDCVTTDHQVWDGKAWVNHEGLKYNGIAEVVSLDGARMTADHEVLLSENRWVTAKYLVQNAANLYQALVKGSANLPSPDISWGPGAASYPLQSSVAAARLNTWSSITTFVKAKVLDAIHALNNKVVIGAKNIMGMQISYPTPLIENACSTVSPHASIDAETQTIRGTRTTEAGASPCMSHGCKTGKRFSNTSSPWTAGIALISSLIESMLIKGMSRIICGLSADPKISKTSDQSAKCSSESMISKQKFAVYDLLNAGPNNRFTIATDTGHLIVHNCQLGLGYGMGKDKFRATCAIGPMGIPPMLLSEEEAWRTVHTYRSNHPWIKASWDWLQNVAIPMMVRKDANIQRGPITIQFESILLPNGLRLQYPNLRATEDGWAWGIGNSVHRLYGGIAQENIIQALAGTTVKEFMRATETELGVRGFSHDARILQSPDHLKRACNKFGAVVHQVHDEILAVVPEKDADDVLELLVIDIMSKSPNWMPNLPARAEGGYAQEYSK